MNSNILKMVRRKKFVQIGENEFQAFQLLVNSEKLNLNASCAKKYLIWCIGQLAHYLTPLPRYKDTFLFQFWTQTLLKPTIKTCMFLWQHNEQKAIMFSICNFA